MNEIITKVKETISEKTKSNKEIQTTTVDDIYIYLQNTIYALKNIHTQELTNHIFIDYTIFKHFARIEFFPLIIEYFLSIINNTLVNFSTIELHINLHTLSISSIEKYKQLLFLFNDKGLCNIIPYIHKTNIYNTPSMIEQICSLFSRIIPSLNIVTRPVIFYSVKESKEHVEMLKRHIICCDL